MKKDRRKKQIFSILRAREGEGCDTLSKRVQTIILGVLIFILPLASLILPDRDFSPSENRALATRPKLSWDRIADGSYTQELSSYQGDQFIFRDGWVILNSITDRLRGQRERNGVYFGSKGYILPEPVMADWTSINGVINAINSFAEWTNADVYMMLVPDSTSILHDYLPAGAPANNHIEDIDKFYNVLSEDIKTIDVATTLQEHRDEYIYYRTDHHWTSLGARYGFLDIAKSMGLDAGADDFEEYVLSRKFIGTLGSKAGSHSKKDVVTAFLPKDDQGVYYVNIPGEERRTSIFVSDALKEKNKYEVFLGGNYSRVEIRTDSKGERNLLLIKDSYANSMVQFLYPYFASIVMVDPRYSFENVQTLMSTEGITDVLFLYSADTLFADKSLKDYLIN